MRISFPNKEQDDTLVGSGETRIGAAADNAVVVAAGAGVAPHHVRLKQGERGIELAVLDGRARTHVNTRPVRERAILRLGDMVSLGSVQFVLKPDRDEDIRVDIPPAAATPPAEPVRVYPPRVLLRGLSGMHFGKIVPVRGRLIVGSGGQADLNLDEPDMAVRHAAIEYADESILLRSLGDGSTHVNGVETRDAVLHAGDQLCFGRERFLVEAPGMPQRATGGAAPSEYSQAVDITQTMKVLSPSAAQPEAAEPGRTDGAGKNDIWWLIAAAAVIAGGMALLFLGIL